MQEGRCIQTFTERSSKQKIVEALMRQKETQVPDTNAHLHDIVDQMLKPHGKTSRRDRRGLSSSSPLLPPFDIERPNQHETKAEFNSEIAVVCASLDHVAGLLRTMLPQAGKADSVALEIQRLAGTVNRKLRERASTLDASTSGNLLRKNAADVGGYSAFSFL